MPTWTFLAVLILPLMIDGSGSWTSAQQPAPRFFVVEENVVDPARTEQYEQAMKTFVEAMKKARIGTEASWNASQHGSRISTSSQHNRWTNWTSNRRGCGECKKR